MKKRIDFRYVILGLLAFAFSMLLLVALNSRTIWAIFYVSAFIAVNAVLASYKRLIRLPIEIELETLGIVICTLEFGIKAGLVVAILGGLVSFIVGFNISPFSFPMLLGYISIAFVSYMLSGYDITLVGIISTSVNNLLVFTMYGYIFRYDTLKNISYSISNVIFNIILFYNIAPLIAGIIH